MNYLSHAFLSHTNEHLLLGNFIADHVRGNQFKNYHPGIIEGIYMHRRIDTFTDSHSLFKESKRIFYQGFEKHSGILVDIYFDHLLAKYFLDYSIISLFDFSKKMYSLYYTHQNLLPASSSRFLEYVVKENIYYSYSKIEGIEKVLFHLSQRIKHNVNLDNSISLFVENEKSLTENFNQFFKDALIEFKI